ncbi:1-acyl-sn-glycerol-3-phosphate acyltransferase [Marinobacterium litorale]|uniref:1-acyl-sn-glycerol-3-phosphate acyltransferase n=1 Tax=Marinobacterium litorale TaxID=404770 RepID=UPI000406D930|nr:1-acyl-sn-glycerol-3-phosphate acyltransferase [Marinobacterium litorale]
MKPLFSTVRGQQKSHSTRRQALITRVLAAPRVQAEIQRQCQGGRDRLQLEQEALADLEEICSCIDPATVERLKPLFNRLLSRLYPRLEVEGLQFITTLQHTHQLIFLPTHRSHIDYLLLSWILHRRGCDLPYIGAGRNLNLPLIGPVLQRGGAVFMRRSFLDDPLYTQLFNANLDELFARARPFEFFPEGTRSRTGRLLPPKLGLLGMCLSAWQNVGQRPLALVPIAISYDLCLDNSQYLRELSGGTKQKETLVGTLASAGRLLRDCGGAYIRVAQPLLLEQGTPPPDTTALAGAVSRRLNSAIVSSGSARLALLLLAGSEPSTPTARVEAGLNALNHLLDQFNMPRPNNDLEPATIIAETARQGLITQQGATLSLTQRQAAGLCFYRNTLQHGLILPALTLLLSARLKTPSKSTVTRLIKALLPYLDAELTLPPDQLDSDFPARARHILIEQGLLEANQHWLKTRNNPLCHALIHLAETLLLRQFLLLKALHTQSGWHKGLLLDTVTRLAVHIHGWYGHQAPDYGDKRLLEPLIDQLERQHLLALTDDRVEVRRDLTPILRIGEKLLPGVLIQESQRWLNGMSSQSASSRRNA